jgi:hypothetical protein
MNDTTSLSGMRRAAMIAGAIGVLGLAIGFFVARDHFFKSYLLGWSLFLALSLGGLAITMLHHITGGAWGFVLRRTHEASMGNLPLMGVLSVPILIGLAEIYPWARPELVAGDELLRHKSAYLNPSFFLVRLAIYFVVWSGMSFLLRRWSIEQDQHLNDARYRDRVKGRLRVLSGPGLVVYAMTVTFASIDLLMSLEPRWFSTIYALLMMVIQALMALAFGTATGALVPGLEALRRKNARSHFHDLGNLMLAFIMLWAYMMLSQYLIIWSGNLTEEVPWYLARWNDSWAAVTVLLVIVHFAMPFFFLLFRSNKRNLRSLGFLACWLLLAVLVDFVWFISPAFFPDGLAIHWLDVAALAGVGGIWLLAFTALLSRHPLIPAGDPDLPAVFLESGDGGSLAAKGGTG